MTGQEIEEGLTADFDTFELRLTHVARTVDIISDAVDEFERRGADNAIGDVAIIARHGHETALPIIFERRVERSEEHTSELQSLMRISYAVFCLKKKKSNNKQNII